jgi:hypothetical protein
MVASQLADVSRPGGEGVQIAREQGWKTTYDAEYLAVTHLSG